MKLRMVVHPVLENKRSRVILWSYLLLAAISNGVMWWFTLRMLHQAGIFIFYSSFQPSWWVGLLVSPIVHVAISLTMVLIGTTLTSLYVIGPVKRLEQWLKDWQAGHKLQPFKVRDKDYLYENIASLINQFHDKNAPQ